MPASCPCVCHMMAEALNMLTVCLACDCASEPKEIETFMASMHAAVPQPTNILYVLVAVDPEKELFCTAANCSEEEAKKIMAFVTDECDWTKRNTN